MGAGWPTLDSLVARTPASRNRVVDAARAGSIVVVTVWHWALSVTFRTDDGGLAMANPIHAIPLGWLATWVLQVMPVFFVVGGYANLAGWQSAAASGHSGWSFVRDRLRRLVLPTAVAAAVWLCGQLLALAWPGPHRWMWQWFPGFLVPLWFLAVYGVLVVAAPLTATAHRYAPAATLGALVALIGCGSLLARGAGLTWAAWPTAALVWVFCHQLGYAWRTVDLGHRPLQVRAAVAAVGLGALVALTTWGGYPRSMVATVADDSNIFPTNAAIAALAVFQVGLLAIVTPPLQRLLRRPVWWKPVVAINGVALTVFLWHMPAYLVAVWVFEALGGSLLDEPTAAWWAQRWVWVLLPSVALAGLVAVFARVEVAGRRPVGRRP